MPKTITLNSTEVTNIAVQKLSTATGVDMNGLECIVYYAMVDNNGNKVMTSVSKKFTDDTDSGFAGDKKLSADSSKVVKDFYTAIQNLMNAREEL
tara:strand:+ start:90 stop:374 length:285 start_codon:yes stop_codon:yes gene_type:complete